MEKSQSPIIIKLVFKRISSSTADIIKNGYKFYVLFLTFLVYASYHLSRKPISIVKTQLHPSNCSNCSAWKPFDGPDYGNLLGYLDSAFLFAYAAGMFISGHIAERTNLRYFLFFGMAGSGVLTALFGLGKYWNIHVLWYYVLVQLACGLMQSTGWPPVVTCVANWFGKGRRGFIMGVWNSHTSLGNIFGALIAGYFVQKDWALSFIVPGLIIIVIGFLVLITLIPHPKDLNIDQNSIIENSVTETTEEVIVEPEVMVEGANEEQNLLSTSILPSNNEAIGFIQALLIPGVIEFSLCLFFAKLVSYTFLFWLPAYISNSCNFDSTKSADLSTLFDVGGIVGGIFAGVISDFQGGRALTCIFMLTLAAPSMYIYQNFAHISYSLNIVLLMISGFFVNGPYALITTAVSADLGTHPSLRGNARALSTVSAIIDGTGSIGAAIGPLLTGLISPYGWQNVFYMLIISDILALLVSLYIHFSHDFNRNNVFRSLPSAPCTLKPCYFRVGFVQVLIMCLVGIFMLFSMFIAPLIVR